MSLREDLERAINDVGHATEVPHTSNIDWARGTCAVLIQTHGQALLEAVGKAAMWDMCNATFTVEETEIRCHITVGVNKWENGHWNGFTTCTPDELKVIVDAERVK